MPSISVIAAFVMALALVGFKLAGVSVHVPPGVAPADLAAQTKVHVVAVRTDETENAGYRVAANELNHSFALVTPSN